MIYPFQIHKILFSFYSPSKIGNPSITDLVNLSFMKKL